MPVGSQELADRIGISRVAVSHLETKPNAHPGERTVVLLAGVFKMDPHELVADTDYPMAKAERLPLVAARYTEAEHQVVLLDRDLAWLERSGPDRSVLAEWESRLRALADVTHHPHDRSLLAEALTKVRRLR